MHTQAGFVNSIAFDSAASRMVVGIGQEHRLGRWGVIKAAKNAVFIVPVSYTHLTLPTIYSV